MEKYQIEYNGGTRIYRGWSALEAIERFDRQNHVTTHVMAIDPETKGEHHAAGWAYGAKGRQEWVEANKVVRKEDK